MATSSRKVFELFVTKIPWTVASREMREYFGQFGPVRSCILPFDRDTGFHKGFCWISFNSEEGLLNTLQKDSHIIEGAKLHIAKNKEPVPRRLTREAED